MSPSMILVYPCLRVNCFIPSQQFSPYCSRPLKVLVDQLKVLRKSPHRDTAAPQPFHNEPTLFRHVSIPLHLLSSFSSHSLVVSGRRGSTSQGARVTGGGSGQAR